MNNDINNDISQAKRELDAAREAHAAALMEQMNTPADPEAQRRLHDAVQQGRGAWKGYQTAATAGLAEQISAIVPSDFFQED